MPLVETGRMRRRHGARRSRMGSETARARPRCRTACDLARVKPRQKVLVHAGAGGLGSTVTVSAAAVGRLPDLARQPYGKCRFAKARPEP